MPPIGVLMQVAENRRLSTKLTRLWHRILYPQRTIFRATVFQRSVLDTDYPAQYWTEYATIRPPPLICREDDLYPSLGRRGGELLSVFENTYFTYFFRFQKRYFSRLFEMTCQKALKSR